MINDPRIPNAFAPPMAIKPSGTHNAIKIIAGIVATLIAVLLGLIVLLLIGVETGPIALMIGLVSATLPVPLYLVLVLWIDRYEAEPFWMLATAFFLGSAGSCVLRLPP
jgi:hypothetical protein